MGEPFANPPTLDDLRAGSVVLAGLGQGSNTLAFDALEAIKHGDHFAIPPSVYAPAGAYAICDGLVIVAVLGTSNYLQWVLNVLGSQQLAVPPFPGKVARFHATVAQAIIAAIGPAVVPALETRRLVVLGHSLGGSVAQLLLSVWEPLASHGSMCITYGSPRVGDDTFRQAVTARVFRVENTIDPIVCVPPVVWLGAGSLWTWPYTIEPANYVHAGTAQTVNVDGEVRDGEEHISLDEAWVQVKQLSAPSHEIAEYQRRLEVAARFEGFGGDYADPEALDVVNLFLLGPDPIGGGPMPDLCQGTLFFRTTEESQGWSESWYGAIAVANMLTTMGDLAKERANFLAGSCEIHAYRASVVPAPGVTRQSRTKRLAAPIHATTSIKSSVASGLTNETMDAIDYLVTSAAVAAKKTAMFRGVPDEWVQGSKLTTDGVDGLRRIEKFLQAVKDANLGFKVYSRGDGFPVKNVKAMKLDVGVSGLILCTCPGHVIPDGSYVTIRRTKANPMLQGRWKITMVDANSFTLNGSGKFNVDSKNDGTVQIYNSGPDSISDFGYAGVSTRKTGRPFGSRRGKRSAKLLHH